MWPRCTVWAIFSIEDPDSGGSRWRFWGPAISPFFCGARRMALHKRCGDEAIRGQRGRTERRVMFGINGPSFAIPEQVRAAERQLHSNRLWSYCSVLATAPTMTDRILGAS